MPVGEVMPVRSMLVLVLAAFLVLAAAPAVVEAQEGECEGVPRCGPYDEDPGEGCNGPNDPFCQGGGGGGGTNTGCAVCIYIPESPDGVPAHYDCANLNQQPRLNDCEGYANGCSSNGFCYIV